MSRYYPAYLDIAGKPCVVIGAGAIAERKVEQLVAAGANVTMVSPEVTPELRRMAGDGAIALVERAYEAGDLGTAFLAIAATDDPAVNRQVRAEASQGRVLLNVVDVAELCDFIAPAVVERGPVSVAVSSSGTSPALARKLRESLETWPPLAWADAAGVLSEVRSVVKGPGAPSPEAWQEAMDDELLALVQAGDLEGAKARLLVALRRAPQGVAG